MPSSKLRHPRGDSVNLAELKSELSRYREDKPTIILSEEDHYLAPSLFWANITVSPMVDPGTLYVATPRLGERTLTV